jgi:hypothetical protein
MITNVSHIYGTLTLSSLKVNAFKSGDMGEKYDFLNGCISATYYYFAEVGTSDRSSDSIRL